MPSSTPKALRAEKARLDEQIKRRRQLEAGRERKRDTRRKVLVGALVLNWMQDDKKLAYRVFAGLEAALDRAVDRDVFARQWSLFKEQGQDPRHVQA